MRRVAGIDPSKVRITPATDGERAFCEVAGRSLALATARVRSALGGFDISLMAQAMDDASLALLDLEGDFADALIGERTWDRFVAEHYADYPYFASAAEDTGKGPADPSVVRFGQDHETMTQPTIVAGGLHKALDSGQTFVIHRIDQYDGGALGTLSEDLEVVLGSPVGTNAYLARQGATGFGSHWDDHHVLILQVRGEKMWEVFEPTHLSPDRDYIDRKLAGPPAWSGILRPGHALVIPRGWSHRVLGLDTLSVHYTVAFSGRYVRDVLDHLPPPPPHLVTTEEVRSWLEGSLADAETIIAQTLAELRANVRPRFRSGLEPIEQWRAAGGDPSRLHLLLPGVAVFHGPPRSDDGITLAWGESVISLDAEEVVALTEFPRRTAATDTLLEQLVAGGLARVEDQ